MEMVFVKILTTVSDNDQTTRLADQWFMEHQTAVLHNDWLTAYTRLNAVFLLRKTNGDLCDRFLLPVFNEFGDRIPHGASPRYFQREQKQIVTALSHELRFFRNKIMQSEQFPLNKVELFDRYYDLKDLLDHHDARKRGFLYPLLDQWLDPPQRHILLEPLNAGLEKLNRELHELF